MARMRTFLIYALLIIGFFLLSNVLENGLIDNMYKYLSGTENSASYSSVDINNVVGRASNVNGYMTFTLKNNSSSAQTFYAQIDLYSKVGNKAATKYVEVSLDANEEKEYNVKIKGNEITTYSISLVSSAPDKTNIINILGWEIDLTNVFGMDLSNTTVFGVKLSELFSWDNAKTAGSNAWAFIKITLASVPWWGYVIGGGIILWYMPSWYLFGIFPF